MRFLTAILPAAGTSSRFGHQQNKLLATLAGKTVIARSVAAFLVRDDVRRIIIPTRDPALRAALPSDPRITFCSGGACRAESVRNAVRESEHDDDFLAIHDAARPLVTQNLITRVLSAALAHGAAGPAVAVTHTIRRAAAPLPAMALGTVPRHDLFAMQTPQIIRGAVLTGAYHSCEQPLEKITDDLQLVENTGHEIFLVDGDEQNLKITTQFDLQIARFLCD